MPGVIANTTPEELIVATLVLLLVQVPPDVASLSVLVKPLQILSVPVIGATAVGVPFTLTNFVALAVPQLLVTVYVIVAEPADAPVTTPVADPIVAWALLLLHVPPDDVSVNVAVPPTHITDGPPIGAADTELTVTAVLVEVTTHGPEVTTTA